MGDGSAEVREAMVALGRRLAACRRAAGISQHSLAAQLHFARSSVANVEVGRQNGTELFWRQCDAIVHADGSLVEGFQTLTAARATALRAVAPTPMLGRTTHGSTARSARLPAAYVPFLPAGLDRPALEWLVDDGVGAHLPRADGRLVSDTDLARAEGELAELREQDHQLGAGSVYPRVDGFLQGEVRRLLAGSPVNKQNRGRAHRIALGALELAGYQAVDLGADGLAQQHYTRALALTRVSGDRSYGAYLLAVSLGHLALHCGHPHPGMRMVQTAVRGVGSAVTPLLGAALHAVLARAYARLGDEKACTQALRAAEAGLAGNGEDNEPAWVRYLTPAYLADEVAHCLFDLGHYESAQVEVGEAVAGIGPRRVRRLAIDTALLASSLARCGRVDEACARGREAADFAAATTSMRAVQRVAQLRVELAPYVDEREVVELFEYLHELLPAAG